MKYFDLIEILRICANFVTNPSDKESFERFEKMKSAIVIKRHLSLEQRQIVLLKTLIDIKADEQMSVADMSASLEISLTFNGLLAYTNIDPDFSVTLKNEEMYDLLWLSGFCDVILDKCHSDFERLEKQVYAMISFDNLRVLLESLGSLEVGNVEELTRAFTEFSFRANPETIKNLAEIARFNDPIVTEIKDVYTQKAYETLSNASNNDEDEEEEETETV